MRHGDLNDLVAIMHQAGQAQAQDMELNLNGRVIEYDPKAGMCRALIDSRRSEDENGKAQAMETGWMHVGNMHVGDGCGDQFHLKGGAAVDNDLGEAVKVSIENRHSGLGAVANLVHTDKMKPPGAGPNGAKGNDSDDNATNDPDQTLQLRPGEHIKRHESGTSMKYYSNGDLGIRVTKNLVINLDVAAGGNVVVNVLKGDLTAKLTHGNALLELTQGNAEAHVLLGTASIIVDAGDIDLTATAGNVAVNASGYVDVTAPTVNIISGIINAGVGVFQQLCNLTFMNFFNAHVHNTGAPGTPTSSPTVAAVAGISTTTNFEAS